MTYALMRLEASVSSWAKAINSWNLTSRSVLLFSASGLVVKRSDLIEVFCAIVFITGLVGEEFSSLFYILATKTLFLSSFYSHGDSRMRDGERLRLSSTTSTKTAVSGSFCEFSIDSALSSRAWIVGSFCMLFSCCKVAYELPWVSLLSVRILGLMPCFKFGTKMLFYLFFEEVAVVSVISMLSQMGGSFSFK